MTPTRPFIMVHGGAGPRAMTKAQRACLSEALVQGYELLKQGATSLNAVEAAVRLLEASGLFNAGVGSRLQMDGVRRMDASIMEGSHLGAGAVAAIERVRHPISAARLVMEQTAHVLLVGRAATTFARHFKLPSQPPPTRAQQCRAGERRPGGLSRHMLRLARDVAVRPRRKRRTDERETVGAVALDRTGCLAAGASTGGIGFMLPGRVGDSPLIGSGVYADDESGAVSMTGLGESIVRIAVAKEITDRLAWGLSPVRAAQVVLKKLVQRVKGQAGALVLSADGRFTIKHVTPRLAAGYWGGRGTPVVADRFT